MKIQILERKGEKIRFIVEGVTPAFANALRRIMISEIPVLAVEWVDVFENSSILFDEMVAHRMGLIPLKFDPDKMNFREDCKCEGKGCPLCEVTFSLEKGGPSIAYSGDMISSNKTIAPTSPKFPIVKLMKNHYIKLYAVAHLGTGKQHAKFQAANASYQYYPEIKGDKCDNPKSAVSACPKGIVGLKGNMPFIKKPEECDFCRACEDACNGISIEGVSNKFVFSVESISGLEPAYIVNKAAEILKEKAEEFKRKIDKI